jgi:hypothetical protein
MADGIEAADPIKHERQTVLTLGVREKLGGNNVFCVPACQKFTESNGDRRADVRRRGGNVADRGAKLSLQDHGDPVWYRSLRLRTIPAGERVVADPTYRPAPVPPEVEAEQMRRLEAAGR